ncbi:hypothetical protein CASFOL_001850 [Castilleja foliolosa]|uniref:Uncharacterized protein n=1 Tax=Castilleja foliolosa TaxID=1961234 RepID=A0ABD3ED87_9LAMI
MDNINKLTYLNELETLMKVFDKEIKSRMDWRCTFVALGCGLIGDMCRYVEGSISD